MASDSVPVFDCEQTKLIESVKFGGAKSHAQYDFAMASGYEKSHDYSGPEPTHVIWAMTLGTLISMAVVCWLIW